MPTRKVEDEHEDLSAAHAVHLLLLSALLCIQPVLEDALLCASRCHSLEPPRALEQYGCEQLHHCHRVDGFVEVALILDVADYRCAQLFMRPPDIFAR